MKKAEFISAVAKKADLPKTKTEAVVNAVFEELASALLKKDVIFIRGFGIFKVIHKQERVGRNPKTGEKIKIPARDTATWRPSEALKDIK